MSATLTFGPAGTQTVKEHNLALVLGAVAKAGENSAAGRNTAGRGITGRGITGRGITGRGITRAQLATLTGLTRATVSSLVDELASAGLVLEQQPERGARGRPGSPIIVNADGAAGLGLEINVDYVAACVLDLSGELRAEGRTAIDNRGTEPGVTLEALAALAAEVCARGHGVPIAGAVVAVPGLVDTDGMLRGAPNLPQWIDLDVRAMVGTALGWPAERALSVQNEANLAALGQLRADSIAGLVNFLHISGEIGIGAGIVLDGELFRGVQGYAGELGHVIVDPGGAPCHCGSRGCLEQLAGQESLLAAAGSEHPLATVAVLVERARAGDPRALRALDAAGSALGTAVVSACSVLDVPTVVLGGIYAELGDWLVGPMVRELEHRSSRGPWSPRTVITSDLGSTAAVRGAAGCVVSEVLARRVHVSPR
jgi:predicted NBD/HSP70 family sugar kinase